MRFSHVVMLIMLLPGLASFYACQGQASQGVHGQIKGADNLQVTLEQSYFDRTTKVLGKATADGNGKFSIKQETPFEQGLYLLTIGAKRLYFILDGKEKSVTVNSSLEGIDRMEVEVSGSEAFSCYVQSIRELIANPVRDAAGADAAVARGCNPFMKAFMALQVYGNQAQFFMPQLKKAGADLNAYMPGSKYALDYNATMATLDQQTAAQASAEKIRVGEEAPDISLPGPDGKMRKLSSLRGKVVLLDFWASWCGPCRRENPKVVDIYNRYKSKGFDIFSVSLDGADPRSRMAPEVLEERKQDGKRKWIAAIEQDRLTWDGHVSDLQHWGSAPAAVYGVQAIPKTFLIGRDGKIIAINPRQNLEEELLKAL